MKGMKISHQTYFASPETEARSGLGVQAVTYTSSTGLSQIECLQMAKPDRPSVAYYEPRGFIQDRESGRIILFIGDRNKLGIMRVIRTELELPL